MTFIAFIAAAAFMARFMAAFFFMTLQHVQQLGPPQVHPSLPQHGQDAEHVDLQAFIAAFFFMTLQHVQQLGP